MGAYIDGSRLVLMTNQKIVRFNLTKKVDNSLNHENDSIIKHNKFFAERK